MLGDETLNASESILRTYRRFPPPDEDRSVLSQEEISRLAEIEEWQRASLATPAGYFDARLLAHEEERQKRRPWSGITGITLHQTDCVLGEKPHRWASVPVHFGVTRQGQVIHLHDVTWVVYHGHALNSDTIGIEIDGSYMGAEDLPNSYNAKRNLAKSDVQIEAARALLRYLVALVGRNGGRLEYVFAHRQGTNTRQPDPGSMLWRELGVWAQEELGLSDGGPGYVRGKGMPLPDCWTGEKRGIAY